MYIIQFRENFSIFLFDNFFFHFLFSFRDFYVAPSALSLKFSYIFAPLAHFCLLKNIKNFEIYLLTPQYFLRPDFVLILILICSTPLILMHIITLFIALKFIFVNSFSFSTCVDSTKLLFSMCFFAFHVEDFPQSGSLLTFKRETLKS